MTKHKIKIASTAGFCFGVRRAITMAEKTAEEDEDKKVFTLGPLIHNPQEVERLARRGITSLENTGRRKNFTLIVRTHGIPEMQKKRLERRKLKLVDATCPFVKRAQDLVKQLAKEGRQVIIVGEKTHPEVVALVSYARGKCSVVETKEDLASLKLSGGRIGVVSQTTQTPENFNGVIRRLCRYYPDAKIYNTICRATIDRQTDARRLAKSVDVMIVVGGKNSGNTRRLFEIGNRYAKTYAVETAAEIRPAWLKGAARIGVTAGASTPDWIIRQVKDKIEVIQGKSRKK